ncbi:hypothetical protein GCM10027176_83670 [Actinoallomurus bryophytorum]
MPPCVVSGYVVPAADRHDRHEGEEGEGQQQGRDDHESASARVLESSVTRRRGNAAGGTAVPTGASFHESLLGEKDHKDPGPHARGVVHKEV